MLSFIASSRLISRFILTGAQIAWEEHEIQRIYRLYRKLSNGCDGKHVGLGGSLSSKSMALIVRAMNIFGSNFVDFGAADGRAMLSAWAAGAGSVVGFELPDNMAQKLVFDAVLARLPHRAIRRVNWLASDIDMVIIRHVPVSVQPPILIFHYFFWQMTKIPKGSDSAFAFWVGMPYSTQVGILDLCAGCPTMETITVFRDRKWNMPDAGI